MGLDFNTEWTGLTGADALIARLTALPGASQQGAIAAMADFAENQFMPYIKENDVPWELGILRDSGDVWLDEDGKTVLMEFGGPGSGAEAYAVEQHERTDYNHPNGGRAKYLEVPLQEWADRFIQAAAEGVRAITTVTVGPWSRETIASQYPGWASMQRGNNPVGFAANAVRRPANAPRLVKKGTK